MSISISIIAIAGSYFAPKNQEMLYPHHTSNVMVYDDSEASGSSNASFTARHPLGWQCDYHTINFAMYCGMSLKWPEREGGRPDLSSFDTMTVKINFEGIDPILKILMVNVEPLQGINSGEPIEKYMQKALPAQELDKTITFSLDDFSPSPWWMKNNNVHPTSNIFKRDNIERIQITTERPDTIRLQKYTLHKIYVTGRYVQPVHVVSVVSILWLFCGIFLYFKKRSERRINELKMKQAELDKACEVERLASLEKSRFLATASHDLRQPIHTLGFLIQNLRLLRDKELDRELAQAFKRMNNNVIDLLDSLMDLSLIELGKIKSNKKIVSLNDLVQNAYDSNKLLSGNLNLRFDHSQPIYVNTDFNLFSRILNNLIGNAVKYAGDGLIYLEISNQQDGSVEIHVRDEGPGISSDDLARIFDAFYQVDNTSRAQDRGLGLGLNIVHKLCALLGYEVFVQSEIGRGSDFWLRLPAPCLYDVESMKSLEREHSLKRDIHAGFQLTSLEQKTILLVENEYDIQRSVKRTLERWGCLVFVADNSLTVEVIINTNPSIDLLLSDYMLTDNETGDTIFELVKSTERYKHIPSVLVTGSSQMYQQKFDNGGWDSVLTKPVHPDELKKVIYELLAASS